MNNRVYGVIGVGSYMANWNADFTNHPKTLGNGLIFGSDKALKYSIRNHMNQNGGKVMFFKSFKNVDGKLQPNNIDERYKRIFGVTAGENANTKEILYNLLQADDVINFGATYAGDKQNISVLGIVQIGQAFNKYEDTEIHTQDILSPFQDVTKGTAAASTLGTQVFTDEAHYVYPFSVNPKALNMYNEILPEIKYETKHYEMFKNGALEGATLLNTTSKMGCENEFAMFIKLKENSIIYLPPLDTYVKVGKEDKVVYNIEKITNLLKSIENDIERAELFYNQEKIKIVGDAGIHYFKQDIITKNQI